MPRDTGRRAARRAYAKLKVARIKIQEARDEISLGYPFDGSLVQYDVLHLVAELDVLSQIIQSASASAADIGYSSDWMGAKLTPEPDQPEKNTS